MKRIDLWKSKLKAANAELLIRYRQHNIAKRGLERTLKQVAELEKKIEAHLA